MYADQLESQTSRSVKDRLNGNFASSATGRRPVAGKRRREEDNKWEHDLFRDLDAPVSDGGRVGVRDLRMKLQKKNIVEQVRQNVRQSASGGARDLREKLSGTVYSRPAASRPSAVGKNTITEASKPTPKSVITRASNPEASTSSSMAKKQIPQKVDSVDNFLQSLGLEKYAITLQAEEVDMAALLHMRDDDLKALGIPMGPRKKILLALESAGS